MNKKNVCEACRSCVPEYGCGGCMIMLSERPATSAKRMHDGHKVIGAPIAQLHDEGCD